MAVYLVAALQIFPTLITGPGARHAVLDTALAVVDKSIGVARRTGAHGLRAARFEDDTGKTDDNGSRKTRPEIRPA